MFVVYHWYGLYVFLATDAMHVEKLKDLLKGEFLHVFKRLSLPYDVGLFSGIPFLILLLQRLKDGTSSIKNNDGRGHRTCQTSKMESVTKVANG